MRSILGHSDHIDTVKAAADVIEQCREALGEELPKGAVLFSSVDYDHQRLLDAIQVEWPGLPLVGGSSDGELSSTLGFRHDSVLLTLLVGDEIEVRAGLGRNLSKDHEQAAREALELRGSDEARLCITTFAPSTNASAVVRTLNAQLGPSCPLVGGLTGDHRDSYTRTKEFFCGEVLTDSLPVLLISGNIKVGWGLGSGWFPVSKEYIVTRSEGNVVHEIDGQPATRIYEEHYGNIPDSSLGEYPLAVYKDEGEENWSLRAILDSNTSGGSLTFAGEVIEGSRVRMTEVLPEGILSGSSQSLSNAITSFGGTEPELAFVFSCAARKWVLGTQAEQEIGELKNCAASHGLPELTIAGLYVFGEISPNHGETESAFHNETCVSLVLGK